MTRDELRQTLKMVIEVYPYAKNKINPKETLDMWEMTFAEYEAKDVIMAVRYHIENKKFFPTPADIKDNMFRANLLYDTSNMPLIDAPTTSYIEDLTQYDDILDFEPDKKCYSCQRYSICYGNKR